MSLGTDEGTAEFIRNHLDDDMEVTVRQPDQTCIRPSLSPFLSPSGSFHLPSLGADTPTVRFVLQVVSIKDVSLSREQRCRAVVRAADLASGHGNSGSGSGSGSGDASADDPAALVDATLQAMEDQNDEAAQAHAPLRPSGGQWRCLRLELSDGVQRVLAVEDVSPQVRQQHGGGVLALEGLALGAKLVVSLTGSAAAAVQHGVLRLHSGNTEVLGGRVRALELYWEAQARQMLAASTGRPSRQLPPQQPAAPQLPLPPMMSTTTQTARVNSVASPHVQQQQQQPSPRSSPHPAASTPRSTPTTLSSPPPQPVQPLRCWPAHVAQHPPQTPFVAVAFITEVVSDMVIHEAPTGCTYTLLAQLSSPEAVEQETQPQPSSPSSAVTADDHLTVDLGHPWLRRLVGMSAEGFRQLSLSAAPADVARLTSTVEAVGQALEQFGKGRFTLVQRAGDGIVEVVKAEPEP